MDESASRQLFNDLVLSNIVRTELGLIEFPVDKLKEFHDAMGLPEDELCYFDLRLPEAQEGVCNYILGNIEEGVATYKIDGAYFFDVETGESESLGYGKLLERYLKRSLLIGNALCAGDVIIDHLGRAWIAVMISDDIGIQLILEFDHSAELGVPIIFEDLSHYGYLRFDGRKFYYSPVTMLYYDGMTS